MKTKEETNNLDPNINPQLTNHVYLVKYDSGLWDTYEWKIIGIFSNRIDAQKVCDDIKRKIEEIKLIPCPVDEEKELEFTEEEDDLYFKWLCELNDAKEFNKCVVVEFVLDKMVE